MKILVIFTGGTIGCVRKGEVLSPDNEQKYMLTQMYLDKYGNVDFDTAEPYTVLSENLEGGHMNLLADCLQSYDLNSYDGIVVTHGTDTLQYTSAFLAYLFDGLKNEIEVGRYHSWVVDKADFPDCLEITAESPDGLIMGLKHKTLDVHGIQFHPESVLTPDGKTILKNFLVHNS